jgi:hypothetical protein
MNTTKLLGVLCSLSNECTMFSVTCAVLHANILTAIINTHKAVNVRAVADACCQR